MRLRLTPRPLVLALLLAAAAWALGGCTDRQSKHQYEAQLEDVYYVRETVLGDLATVGLDDVTSLAKAQRRIEQVAQDMDSTVPPADVQQAHDAYVESLRGMSRMLGQLADCARLAHTNQQQGVECRKRIEDAELDEIENDFNEADTIYRARGYKLPAVGK